MSEKRWEYLGEIQDDKRTEYGYCEKPVYDLTKRAADIGCSLLALVVLSPVFLAVSLLVKLEDGGDVFYSQSRVGLNGKSFRIYKFRSMRPNADHVEDMLTPAQLDEYRRHFRLANDPRLTKIGAKIRSASLDELPQLLNILKGEISVVGPRPILREELEAYGDNRNLLLRVKPGLTGYWQAYARHNASYHNYERQGMDLYYVTHRSLVFDIRIVMKTIASVVLRKGAF